MNRPKLSIIIPAYNEEKFIEQTLLSLANQVNSNGQPVDDRCFQIIIVNNASTDNTVEIVNNFISKNKNILCHIIDQNTKSVVLSRITGYNYVINNPDFTTELLASGDSDVCFHPLWVNTVLNKFNEEKCDII